VLRMFVVWLLWLFFLFMDGAISMLDP